jgi:hypothetical protein
MESGLIPPQLTGFHSSGNLMIRLLDEPTVRDFDPNAISQTHCPEAAQRSPLQFVLFALPNTIAPGAGLRNVCWIPYR